MIRSRVRSRVASAVALTSLLLSGGCSGSASRPGETDAQTGPAPTQSSSSTSEADVESVREAVEERMALFDGIVTGMIVLVRVGHETTVLTRGRSVRGGAAMTPEGTWPIASISKMMTATLVLQLVEEGRLGLDDDVRRWLPELDAMGRVTVEQLLSHRSGLVQDPPLGVVRRIGFDDTPGLLRVAAERGPELGPGSEGLYSNVGYAALGVLVERVLDRPLAEALRTRIFEPTGMDSSALGGRPTVQGYDSRPVRNYYLGYLPGAGSVVSTVADVDAFLQALWAGDLVGQELVADMRESRGPVQIGPFLRQGYGLGVMHQSVSCGDVLGHGGRIGGFTNEAWSLTDGTRSVVVTVNDQDADTPVRSILETALCG